MELARARMMDAVPTADVVVTNPTHFAVALRYSADALAPVVVAKGQDLVALRIREIAREAGVAVVPDPPLARALHGTRRDRAHDPRGALPGRRRAARLRLPSRREDCGMNSFMKQGRQATPTCSPPARSCWSS